MGKSVFVSGGTGYIGRPLIVELLRRGHRVRALARAGSAHKLPPGCEPVIGDALDSAAYRPHLARIDVLVHLVGVAHPSPAKAAQFHSVDLASARAAAEAAAGARVPHFVYLSVAHPAPVMRAYVAARSAAEQAIRQTGLNATILRPWYVLGPGHRWPLLLAPVYWLLERLPPTRDSARRLGLVRLPQIVAALARAVEDPARGVRVVPVPDIREAGRGR